MCSFARLRRVAEVGREFDGGAVRIDQVTGPGPHRRCRGPIENQAHHLGIVKSTALLRC
jgi:hypothetical protein